MVVLVALTATLYAAILIPFKVVLPFMPGLTEFRPGNVIPIVCSLLFGPAAAWGAAFGNLIGDSFGGTLSLGCTFGFVGNFLDGYLPYKVWGRLLPRTARPEPTVISARQAFEYGASALAASAGCALLVGWGVDLIGMAPFSFLGNLIFLNNFIVSVVLGPALLVAVYPRVKRWGLLHTDILEPSDRSRSRLGLVGALLVWAAVIWGMTAGNLASLGVGGHILQPTAGTAGHAVVAVQAGPAVALLLVACLLL